MAVLIFTQFENVSLPIIKLQIEKNDFYFEDRFNYRELDWHGPDKQNCIFKYAWLIYGYQTCFIKVYDYEVTERGSYEDLIDHNGEKIPKAFIYVYTSPVKKLSLSLSALKTSGRESPRFRAPAYSAIPYVIYQGGKVERGKNPILGK